MITIDDAIADDVGTIRHIADETWWPSYGPILPHDQIQYMLDTLYSREVLTELITKGVQRFIVLRNNAGPVGFASFSVREDDRTVHKVHKLYILPDCQGNGFGSILLNEIKRRLLSEAIHTIDLNVARRNVAARAFYEKVGFTILREEEIQLGPYLLQDYVMRLRF
jgi:ribosomal protein S18 acetylase RimI-like enzyme